MFSWQMLCLLVAVVAFVVEALMKKVPYFSLGVVILYLCLVALIK